MLELKTNIASLFSAIELSLELFNFKKALYFKATYAHETMNTFYNSQIPQQGGHTSSRYRRFNDKKSFASTGI